MEQFSHDLTLALEETSRCSGVRASRWGIRRRTRSTGNLPCAPQPTEDSSSSPAEGCINTIITGNDGGIDGHINSILSDSDDRQELKLSIKSRQASMFGNFESDSLNENFSPARPNTRRKRKFRRMAVEYETTPSTPGNTSVGSLFPIAGTIKKRVLKHTSQENFRANLLFCGKRKRSHRDRYNEFDHKQHSSSVPRQRDFFLPRNSYMEYRSRNRSFSKPCERILPLNKSIVSKIERISQDSRHSHCTNTINNNNNNNGKAFQFPNLPPDQKSLSILNNPTIRNKKSNQIDVTTTDEFIDEISTDQIDVFEHVQLDDLHDHQHEQRQQEQQQQPLPSTSIQNVSSSSIPASVIHSKFNKSGSFESPFTGLQTYKLFIGRLLEHKSKDQSHALRKQHKHKKLLQQFQFDDPNVMDCGIISGSGGGGGVGGSSGGSGGGGMGSNADSTGFNEFLSSSSLSSSDSEAAETNDSDREGDDELTDWPGNEAMVNFTSKNDFKCAKTRTLKTTPLPLIKSEEMGQEQDDDTLMSADEIQFPENSVETIVTAAATSSSIGISSSSSSHVIPLTTTTTTITIKTVTSIPSNATVKRSIVQEQSGISSTVATPTSSLYHNSHQPPTSLNLNLKYTAGPSSSSSSSTIMPSANNTRTGKLKSSTMPINIIGNTNVSPINNQIESEASGETSNHFLSSPNTIEVREIRAGCRRVRNERPGFTILTSVNEELSKFLQDARQIQLKLPDTDAQEHENLLHLARLYSLKMHVDNGCAILTKTSNTTQAVKIDQKGMSSRFLNDYKRRCYGEIDEAESSGMAS